jgi:hypothetical protein
VDRAPDGRITDKELVAMSIDPSTARRQFKRHYGMTFQAYHRARRMGLALCEVRRGGRIDDAQNFVTVHGIAFPTTVSAGTHPASPTDICTSPGNSLLYLHDALSDLCQRKKRERVPLVVTPALRR